MNLLVSYDWLKEYVGLKETAEEFAARVSLSGPGVERLYPQGADLAGIVVGHVREIKPHPNADKLRVVIVDAGKKLSIVCGGSNVKEDQWVAVATVGSKVRWHGEGDLIELKPTEIRGVESEGMICAANEIGLFEAFPHAEREILDLGASVPGAKWKAGMSLAKALDLEGDVVMDTEVTTNRPDAMSMVGMAREAAAILKRPFLWKSAKAIKEGKQSLSIKVDDKKWCPRFMVVRVNDVHVASSPWWMKRRLISAGIRPINNLVDITNYVLLELGRPMHVFDADKITGHLHVRLAKKGESIAALDGKTYQLQSNHLVIADDHGPQSIAGIMGGEASGVTAQTKHVIFESALWDPVHIRRTARDLNLSSEAQALFEKGLSTESAPFGLNRAVELCQELAGGMVASRVFDSQTTKYKPLSFSISFEEMNSVVGIEIPKKEAVDTLKRLGFDLKANSSKLTAIVPWWRDHDIESGRDLVEEVARVYGYGRIPPMVPVGLASRPQSSELLWEDRLRTVAKGAGLTEIYTYSFVSESLLMKADFDPSKLLKVQNELSSDFVYMRTSLLPSMLQVIAENQERFREQQLFEVAHAYFPHQEKQTELPDERLQLSVGYLGGDDVWKKAKGFAEHLYQECGIDHVEWHRLENDPFWHPGRTVQAFTGDTTLLGTMGEVHPLILQRFGIEGRVAMVDASLEEIFAQAHSTKRYTPLPSFPEAKRDLALVVPLEVEVQKLIAEIKNVSRTIQHVEWFDTYRGEGIPADKKSVALHLTFSAPDRTLETKEVDEMMETIAERLVSSFRAVIRA
ncbi:phenylalanine--tRNA ligase subunit beta [Candidatus Uhrbacteria bacterium]|nr:phenylalanine--tRNA ligase subunit beta [Candidatus Uhrbacteria bacterium]